MTTLLLNLEDDLAALMGRPDQPIQREAHELIVLELFRRGSLSSGRAAELLSKTRTEFIQYASSLGIPFFDMSDDEWQAEQSRSNAV